MDDYTTTPNRLRIFYEDHHDGTPWHLDAIDTRTGQYSEACARFRYWIETVNAMRGFANRLRKD